MKTVGRFDFPETLEEAESWTPAMELHWLNSTEKIAAVAVARQEGSFAVYIAVAPNDWDYETIAMKGTKQPYEIGDAIFPHWAKFLPYAS